MYYMMALILLATGKRCKINCSPSNNRVKSLKIFKTLETMDGGKESIWHILPVAGQ